MGNDNILELEKQLWSGSTDASTYDRLMTEDSISVMEPMGFIPKAQAVDGTKQSAGWDDVQLTDVKVIELTPDCQAIAYHGSAKSKKDGSLYNGSILSVWVKRDGEWKMAATSHQPWKKEAS